MQKKEEQKKEVQTRGWEVQLQNSVKSRRDDTVRHIQMLGPERLRVYKNTATPSDTRRLSEV